MGEIDKYREEVAMVQSDVGKLRYENITSGYQAALQVVDDVVLKSYIGNLSSMPVCRCQMTFWKKIYVIMFGF